MTRAKNRLGRVVAAKKKLRSVATASKRRVTAVPRWRWIAGGVAAAAAVASAGVAVVDRVRRRSTDETAPESTGESAPAQPGAAVRKAVDAAATAATVVKDRTNTMAHRAADGARHAADGAWHTVARARAATRGEEQPGDQPGGQPGTDGARPSKPEATTPTGR